MIYVQLDVELRDHERITGAPLLEVPEQWRPVARAAMLGLFTWCLCYAQAKRSKEGLIPRGTVHGALNGGHAPTASHLVEAGLLEEFETHYRIRNYADKNRTREEIERSIDANAERQRRFRARKSAPPDAHVTPPVTPVSRVTPVVRDVAGDVDLDLSGESQEDPERQATPPPPSAPPEPPRASGGMGFAADGWIDGVRSVTGGRPTLAPWERRDIEELARDRPSDAEPYAWGRAEGAAFAKRQRACVPAPQAAAKNYFPWVGDGRPGPFDHRTPTGKPEPAEREARTMSPRPRHTLEPAVSRARVREPLLFPGPVSAPVPVPEEARLDAVAMLDAIGTS